MSDLDLSPSRRYAAANQFLDVEPINSDGNGDDIDDGIDGSDLVKVNFFDCRSVNFRFRFGHGVKDSKREISLVVIQPFGLVDDLTNIAQVAMGVLFLVLVYWLPTERGTSAAR